MKLVQEDQKFKEVSIKELERSLSFEYLPSLIFQNSALQQHLFEQAKEREIRPLHLENGARFKKEIEESYIAPVSVRWIDPEIGFGLFAEVDLEEGTYIGEYVGEVRPNNNHLFLSDYLYSYPILDEIGRNYVIDAHKGCLTRFINHSYQPNLDSPYAFVDGFYHMILLANRPIKKGEQLSFNYGKNYWAIRTQPKEL